MTFTNPTAFWGLLIAIPVIICYLLKVRMRRIPVSTVMFWEQVFEEKNPRSLWQQLRHVVSLIAQLIFLIVVVLALADPISLADVQAKRRIVLVIDNSASMQVIHDGRSRLDAAKARAESLIHGMKPQDEMAIIAVNSNAHVVTGLTRHQQTLQKSVTSVASTDGSTAVGEAIQLGRRLLADHQHGEIVVLTDRDPVTLSGFSEDSRLRLETTGAPVDNVAITKFQVRKTFTDSLGYEVLIEVANFSDQPVDVDVEFSLGGKLQDVVSLQLDAMEVWSDVLPNTSTVGGVLSARLDIAAKHRNQLSVDDNAYAVLPRRERIPITLVTTGNWFLQHVLSANDLVDLTITENIPADFQGEEILVLHRDVPETIPAGRVLVVQPSTDSDLWRLDGSLQQPLAGNQDKKNPLLRHVRLTNVLMPQAVRLQPIAEHERLIDAVSGDPLYLRFPRDSGDVVVLCVDLDQSDLPLRTAFPIMLTNLVSWFAGVQDDHVKSMSAGTLSTMTLPGDIAQTLHKTSGTMLLMSPSKTSHKLTFTGATASVGPLNEVGVYSLMPPNDELDRDLNKDFSEPVSLACNLTNAGESNLQLMATSEDKSGVANAELGGRPLWFYLIFVAFAFSLTEWALFHRRSIA